MPFMTRLEDDLKRYFPTVEAVPNWKTKGNPSFAPGVVVGHWTAGPLRAALDAQPSLRVVVDGRPGLGGPLCNVYLRRNGVPVLVAAGRANHAGPGGWRGLVGNSAAYGIEAESGGDGDWTPAQRRAYPVLVAAMLGGLGRTGEFFCGHNEWAPTRKIDIRDWPTSLMRSQVDGILTTKNSGGNFMAGLSDKEQREMFARIMGGVPDKAARQGRRLLDDGDGEAIANLVRDVRRLLPDRQREDGTPALVLDGLDGGYLVDLLNELKTLLAAQK